MTVPTPYEDLLREISEHGKAKGDRTGTGTVSLFGRQLRYDLADSFPLLTTKKVFFKGVVGELLWFLRGESNIAWLKDNGIRIWNEWPTRTATSARSTACSGAPGPPPTGHTWTRSRRRCGR